MSFQIDEELIELSKPEKIPFVRSADPEPNLPSNADSPEVIWKTLSIFQLQRLLRPVIKEVNRVAPATNEDAEGDELNTVTLYRDQKIITTVQNLLAFTQDGWRYYIPDAAIIQFIEYAQRRVDSLKKNSPDTSSSSGTDSSETSD